MKNKMIVLSLLLVAVSSAQAYQDGWEELAAAVARSLFQESRNQSWREVAQTCHLRSDFVGEAEAWQKAGEANNALLAGQAALNRLSKIQGLYVSSVANNSSVSGAQASDVQWYNVGIEAMNRKDYAAAIAAFTKANMPELVKGAHLKLGDQLALAGKDAAAVEQYRLGGYQTTERDINSDRFFERGIFDR